MTGTTDTNAFKVAISNNKQLSVGYNTIIKCSAIMLANWTVESRPIYGLLNKELYFSGIVQNSCSVMIGL